MHSGVRALLMHILCSTHPPEEEGSTAGLQSEAPSGELQWGDEDLGNGFNFRG